MATKIEPIQEDLLKKIQSFNETHQSAYTHGLEHIYSLEQVDSSSIRRIGEGPKLKAASDTPRSEVKPEQIFFDFSEEYRDWIPSFALQESVEELGLSSQLVQLLKKHHFEILSDLIDFDLNELTHLSGVGQGHIDELEKKLEERVKGRSLKQCRQIDFEAWIRVLCGSLDKRKAFVVLEPYGLSYLIRLTAAEKLDIHRLSLEMRQEWVEQTIDALTHGDRLLIFQSGMRQIANALLKPWIAGRMGLALSWEINERLLRLSEERKVAAGALKFFNEIYYDGQEAFGAYLVPLDHQLYSCDMLFGEMYHKVFDRVSSYFYSPENSYSMPHLFGLVSREFALSWEGFPEGFIEKSIRYCPRFRVRKGESGELVVRRNPFG